MKRSTRSSRLLRLLGVAATGLLTLVTFISAASASDSAPSALPTITPLPTGSVLPSPSPPPAPAPAPAPSSSPQPDSNKKGSGGSGSGSSGSGGSASTSGDTASTSGSKVAANGTVPVTASPQKEQALTAAAKNMAGEGTTGCVTAPTGALMVQLSREEPVPTLTLPEVPGMDGPQNSYALGHLVTHAARHLHMSPRQAFMKVVGPFPLAGPAAWSNDWHAYRPCPYPHLHQGLDIFASRGTPVVAIVDGVITEKATSSMSGNYVQITDPKTHIEYFYDHFNAFAPGIHHGQLVKQGQVVGYVGNTGDAAGGPTHLHLEVQPDGIPTPPKPFVDRWLLRAMSRARQLAGMPAVQSETQVLAIPLQRLLIEPGATATVVLPDQSQNGVERGQVLAAQPARIDARPSSNSRGTTAVPAAGAGLLAAVMLLALGLRRRIIRSLP